jgi:hypothetical protein
MCDDDSSSTDGDNMLIVVLHVASEKLLASISRNEPLVKLLDIAELSVSGSFGCST